MAELSQAQEGTKALMARVQELETEKASKVTENRGKLALTSLQLEASAVEKAKDRETKLAVAELGAKIDRLTLFMEERARVGADAHDTATAAADAGHEEAMGAQAHAQALAQGAQQGQIASDASDQQHGQALEQGQQDAALAPSPQADGAGE
jgi:hypothetical protein